MSGTKMKFEPVDAHAEATGAVAYMRMPLKLLALDAMSAFIELAYGNGCICTEDPQGWLKVSTPAK